jgi:hypothetical protein
LRRSAGPGRAAGFNLRERRLYATIESIIIHRQS